MPNKTKTYFSARKRLIVVAIAACFVSAPAWGNPTAPQVVNGSASFTQAGKLLTVTNSNGAIINWNSFSIGAGETTRFNQASAASSVLNRVIANDPSVLLGTLSSNGRVWLVNPAGIMVGQGARIDVGGFIASTLKVRNEDFLAGRLNFGATPNAGKIENRGQITTPSGGSVYLIAPAVENHGIINAPNGEVILAAGQTAQLIDTGTPGVKVDITGATGDVTNLGEIVSEAGRIGMAGVLVKNSGVLNASSVVKDGGRVFLRATKKIELADTGVISADGTHGGQIVAKVEDKGQLSGELVAGGELLARGDGTKGSGGFVETSAKTVDINRVRVNTRGGNWLLDPDDVEINSNGTITGATLVTPGTIQTALSTNNFVIQTDAAGTSGNGDIFVNDAVSWNSGNSLTLNAFRDINVSQAITNSGSGGLNLYANASGTGGSILLNPGVSVATNGGNVTLGGGASGTGGSILLNPGASIATNGGNVTLGGGPGGTGYALGTTSNPAGIQLDGATIDAGGGHIGLSGIGVAGTDSADGIYVTNGSRIQTIGAGTITLNGIGGAALAYANRGIRLDGATRISSAGGDVSMTGTGGASGDGVQIVDGTVIKTNGGALTITGIAGGRVESSDNYGIYIYDAAIDTSKGGAGSGGSVILKGTGGNGSDYNYGVSLENASITTGGGALNVSGTGGGTGDDNYGIYTDNAILDTSKSDGSTGGAVTLSGMGGDGFAFNYGVYLDYGTSIATGGGTLDISGTGRGTGHRNYGVYADNASLDSGRGDSSTGGIVTLFGTGGNGSYSNYGVYLDGGGYADYSMAMGNEYTTIRTGGGALRVTGIGGGTGYDNNGISTYYAILDTGKGDGSSGGNIVLNGTGANGTSFYNHGVYLDQGTFIRTGRGKLDVIGVGGDGGEGRGISIESAILDTSGPGALGGAVNLDGKGGRTGFANYGIYLNSTTITAGGDLILSGLGGGGGSDNQGVVLNGITIASSGNVTVAGSAGAGTGSYDIRVQGKVILRADSEGTGSGTVNLGSSNVMISSGRADIYYNPDSYAAADPTSSDANHDPYRNANHDPNRTEITGPYTAWMLVNDVNHLQAMNTNLVGNYALGKNIDASAAMGFVPVGADSARFAGQLDGLNQTVNKLTINLPSASELGLFGVVDAAGAVRNVGLAGGGVTGLGNAGQLVGTNYGSIVNAYASGSVNGGSTLGGLVGANYGSISNSCASANVSGGSTLGGLVGANYGSISNSYAIGSVSGSTQVGGLVGRNNSGSTVSNSYATGLVTATGSDVGGLVGINSGIVSNSFWDSLSSGTLLGIGGGVQSGATDMASFSMNQTALTAAGFDFDTTWWMSDGNTRPFLRSEWSTSIHNAHQLQLMALDLSASYKLANNIDMQAELASGMWNIDKGFVPVGNIDVSDSSLTKFSGQFDGRGHTISKLFINRPSEKCIGLFGYVEDGVVMNVGLVAASVSGGGYVGALVGDQDYSSITNSYSSGSVSGSFDYVGGLVGHNHYGTISNSYTTGSVSGSGYYVGGLEGGDHDANINNSHSDSTVDSSGSYVGGLVGWSFGGKIRNSHATGDVTSDGGGYYVGGLVGGAYSDFSIHDSYATGKVTSAGGSYVGGLVGENYGTIDRSYSTSVVNSTGSSVGGLVGYNEGSISNSYATGGGATGSVSGSNYVGGLVGENYGSIDLSYSSAVVLGSGSSVGGLVGYNEGSISNSYATGYVEGMDLVGGLVGENYGTIDRTYSTGAVVMNDGSNVGGLVGYDEMDEITNSYWDINASLQSSSAGGLGVIGKTSTEMRQLSTFGGWSIANTGGSNATWRIYEGDTTPLLRSFLRPITVTANDASKVYDKVAFAGNGVSYSEVSATLSGTPSYSGASKSAIGVGSYAINVSGLFSDQQGYDISYAPGTLSITARALSVTATGVNKIYDATMNAVVDLGDNRLSGDVLALGYGAASFGDKNVGTAKPVNVNGIAVSGTDAGNYTLINAVAATSADITPATLTLSSASAANKVYDGTTFATMTGGTLSGVLGSDAVSVHAGTGAFSDKNAGAAKTVTANVSDFSLTGTDAGNYKLGGTTVATTADITVRPLSTWTGGATGNWSSATNWDALPDLSNVQAVSVPTGTSVTYDAAAGSTNLASLTAGGLSIAGGSLSIANSLTVNSSFTQTAGTLSFGPGASASITQASGNLNLPAIAVAKLSASAPAGAIAQSGPITALALNTQSQGATTLANPDNQITDRVDMSAGGPLTLWASGDLNLGAINAGANAVEIKAGGAILKAPGTETSTNITAGAANLASLFGGKSGGLAISTDTQITGALAASVGSATAVAGQEADFGGIRIKNTGVQPASVTLADNALAGASVSFLNTGNIASTSGFTLATLKGGDIALLSNGSITWDGGSLSTPSGSVHVSAEGSVDVKGALSSAVDLALSSGSAINVGGSVSTGGTGTASFTAPSVAINGSVNAADDVGIIATTLNLGAGSSTGAGHDAIFAVGNMMATNASVAAGHDISAAVTGELRLNSSSLVARNDIFINMMGAGSTLYLNDAARLPRSYVWAQAPSTIHLYFPARTSAGLVVDGVAVEPVEYASLAGGSGLFYGAAMNPASPGAGLELSYSGTNASDSPAVPPTVVNAAITAVNASTTSATGPTDAPPLISGASTPSGGAGSSLFGGSTQTIGGTTDSFGGSSGASGSGASAAGAGSGSGDNAAEGKKDEKKDGNKNKKDEDTGLKKQADKPAAKKLAICS